MSIFSRKGSSKLQVRVVVPLDLREALGGKTQLWKSLETSDRRAAKLRAAAIEHAWQVEFDNLRRRRAATTHDLAKAGWRHYVSELEQDAAARANFPSDEEIERERAKAIAAIEALPTDQLADGVATMAAALDYGVVRDAAKMERLRREALKVAVKRDLASGRTDLVEWAADSFIEHEKLLIEEGSPEYKALCQRLLRAQLAALESASERDEGYGTERRAIQRLSLQKPTAQRRNSPRQAKRSWTCSSASSARSSPAPRPTHGTKPNVT